MHQGKGTKEKRSKNKKGKKTRKNNNIRVQRSKMLQWRELMKMKRRSFILRAQSKQSSADCFLRIIVENLFNKMLFHFAVVGLWFLLDFLLLLLFLCRGSLTSARAPFEWCKTHFSISSLQLVFILHLELFVGITIFALNSELLYVSQHRQLKAFVL